MLKRPSYFFIRQVLFQKQNPFNEILHNPYKDICNCIELFRIVNKTRQDFSIAYVSFSFPFHKLIPYFLPFFKSEPYLNGQPVNGTVIAIQVLPLPYCIEINILQLRIPFDLTVESFNQSEEFLVYDFIKKLILALVIIVDHGN